MKEEAIRLQWEEFVNNARYKKYMMSYKETWYDTLSKAKAYMDEHECRPSQVSKDKEIRSLGYWISDQIQNYKKKMFSMKDEAIRLQWEEFVTDDTYKEHFMSGDEAWYDKLSKVKAYMDEYGCRPSKTSKDKEIR